MTQWYEDWQSQAHAERFDARSQLGLRSLIRNYEAFNDVQLLNERVDAARTLQLLEVGCATGEFSRYVRARFPRLAYAGVDLSVPAIERARQKYPQGTFLVADGGDRLDQTLAKRSLQAHPAIVYAKDVIQHQVQPLEFLAQLLEAATEAVIIRARTRDAGPTEWDPELSCQRHYGGWMPYIVVNVQELIDWIRPRAPQSEIVLYRNHMILGGRHDRFVPKELYTPEAGTAETAVGIFARTEHPGRVVVHDRAERTAVCTWDDRVKLAVRKVVEAIRR